MPRGSLTLAGRVADATTPPTFQRESGQKARHTRNTLRCESHEKGRESVVEICLLSQYWVSAFADASWLTCPPFRGYAVLASISDHAFLLAGVSQG